MKDLNKSFSFGTASGVYDEGLRNYMNAVYKFMAIALCVTAGVAFLVSQSNFLLKLIYGTPLSFLFILAPLIFVFYFSAKIWSMSAEKARNMLWVYSGLIGISLSSIFLVYTGVSIVKTFLVSASMFGAMSLYGYTTKKDLSAWGSFLMMGLIGILVASLVNLFFRSPGMEFAISIIGVLVFTGLTAYDVQKIKEGYNYVGINSDVKDKIAVMSALNLYMDFINIFLYMLRFMGEKRN